jgi:hypothetical protein
MPDLFKEIIPSILQTKKCVINDDIDAKDYNAFVVNRALSYHVDCVPYVNEINLYPQLDKDMQYQYYLNNIRQMKRKFQPWQKSEMDKNIECVKIYFGYSDQKAKDALKILTEEQIAEIKIKTDKGGVKK